MLCQNCQKRLANVHLTQVINNERTELYLCEECARERDQIGFTLPMGLSNFITGLLGGYPASQTSGSIQRASSQQITCDKCGMTFEQFRQQGKVGCARCYEVFADKLNPIIRNLHGNVTHVGKMPHGAAQKIQNDWELEDLKHQLDLAIKNEEYEKAAIIRDKIKALTGQNKNQK